VVLCRVCGERRKEERAGALLMGRAGARCTALGTGKRGGSNKGFGERTVELHL
jgi:hypothetical protein